MKKVILTVLVSLIFIAFSNAQIKNETEKEATPTQVETVIKEQVKKADSTNNNELTTPPVYAEPTQSIESISDPETPVEPKSDKQKTPYIDD